MAEQVMVIGVDESEHSFYALKWILQRFFCPNATPYKLVIVHAKPTPSSVLGIVGPGAVNVVLPILDADLKKIAYRTLQKAKDICIEHKVKNVQAEIVEGDARNVICDAVEKYHASILVVGSHNYGVIKSTNAPDPDPIRTLGESSTKLGDHLGSPHPMPIALS